ncbi:MAG: ankyrin repeat domain-containing protein [Acidobacteriota bacterium]
MRVLATAIILALILFGPLAPADEIHDAALAGDTQKVKELLAKDASLLTSKGRNDKQPIHWAAQGDHKELVAFLLDKGAPVDSRNIVGETPLVYAADGGHLEMARFLVAKGADVNAVSVRGADALQYAIWGSHLDVAKFLVEKGADPKRKEDGGFTLLHGAANGDSLEMVAWLVAQGIPVDAKSDNGATPLLHACFDGNPDIVAFLIKKGADVNVRSAAGWSPLYLSVRNGKRDAVALLLEAGAKVDQRENETERSVLHIAAAKGYADVVDLLVQKGADVNAKDFKGATPYYFACRYGHKKIAGSLAAKGAKVDDKTAKMNCSRWVKEPIESGQAVVWYLGHSGWAVRTKDHLLIFDYWKRGEPSTEPSLADGTINPSELAGMKPIVFVSHEHGDHFMPAIFEWSKTMPGVTYVMGFKPEKFEEYTMIPCGEKKTVDGAEILPIESNDSGQGYYVRVDGVSIFHPGDHANRQRDFSGPFKKQIDLLADAGLKADILFTPVSGCGFGDIVAVKKGAFYTIDRLSARAVFPMHSTGNEGRYREFAKEAKNAGYDVQMGLAQFDGDHFIVTTEGVKYAFGDDAKEEKTDVAAKACRSGS